MMQDADFMRIALQEAQQAAREGEMPVGAVLKYQGRVLVSDHHRVLQRNDPLAHAELLVLQSAIKLQPDPWLLDSTLYVTLEPCVMCAGALILYRVKRLVYAVADPKAGACGSTMNIVGSEHLHHHLEVASGILQQEVVGFLEQCSQRSQKSE